MAGSAWCVFWFITHYISVLCALIWEQRRVRNENEKLLSEIYRRMQALDDEMNTILAMINSFAFPSDGKRNQPVCAITLLKKGVSTKTKIAEFTRECRKP